jgi:hypothetical protein
MTIDMVRNDVPLRRYGRFVFRLLLGGSLLLAPLCVLGPWGLVFISVFWVLLGSFAGATLPPLWVATKTHASADGAAALAFVWILSVLFVLAVLDVFSEPVPVLAFPVIAMVAALVVRASLPAEQGGDRGSGGRRR